MKQENEDEGNTREKAPMKKKNRKPKKKSLETPTKNERRETMMADATPLSTMTTPPSSCSTPHQSDTPNSHHRRHSNYSRPQENYPSCHFPKTVFLIRHGESLGQVAKRNGLDRRRDVTLTDAGLTPKGIQQAHDVPHLLGAAAGRGVSMELIVSSPLTRALHTAALAFSERQCPLLVHYDLCEVGSSRVPENTPRLMENVLRDLRHVPRVAEMDVRSLQPEDWPYCSINCYDSPEHRSKKIRRVMQWLAEERRETVIAVVCHFRVIRVALKDHAVSAKNATPIPCHLFADGTLRIIPQEEEVQETP